MFDALGRLLAETAEQTTEIVEPSADGSPLGACLVGLTILAVWLRWYGGFGALKAAPIRRHCLPTRLPFVLFLVWLTLMAIGIYLIDQYLFCDDQAAQLIARNGFVLILNTATIAYILYLARHFFARGLRGFGLRPKTLLRDAGWAVVNLAAVYPLIIGGIVLVTWIGKMLAGDAFAIPTHQTLEELKASEPQTQILLVFLVTAVVPVMEEMLFRGLMQSAFKAILPGVWPAIVATSVLFALVHYSTHALSIFSLSCCIGYAYERSGSLFRPIFIHIFFNAASTLAALMA